jgi:hypothetical protein
MLTASTFLRAGFLEIGDGDQLDVVLLEVGRDMRVLADVARADEADADFALAHDLRSFAVRVCAARDSGRGGNGFRMHALTVSQGFGEIIQGLSIINVAFSTRRFVFASLARANARNRAIWAPNQPWHSRPVQRM